MNKHVVSERRISRTDEPEVTSFPSLTVYRHLHSTITCVNTELKGKREVHVQRIQRTASHITFLEPLSIFIPKHSFRIISSLLLKYQPPHVILKKTANSDLKLLHMFSPLVRSDGRMSRYPSNGLPMAPVPFCIPPPSRFPSIPGHRTGPFGPVVTVRVILTPAASESTVWLADALAAAQSVDHVLRDGFVKTLPVLLGNEDSGEHHGI